MSDKNTRFLRTCGSARAVSRRYACKRTLAEVSCKVLNKRNDDTSLMTVVRRLKSMHINIQGSRWTSQLGTSWEV